jgi:hypothetical protein
MWLHVVACVVGIALVPGARAASLTDTLAEQLPDEVQLLSPALAQAIGRAIPVLSVSPGVRFEYDPETGAFARRLLAQGQVLVDDATTIGAKHWNASLSYEYLQLDRVGGEELRELAQRAPLSRQDAGPIFTMPRLDIDVAIQQAAFNFTYGVTERLDVQVVLPFVHADLVRRENIHFAGVGPETTGTSGDASGLGDLFLRGKLELLRGERMSMAAAVGLRIPTGDEDDLLGAGLTEVTPALYVASAPWQATPSISARLKVNLAMALAADDLERSQGRWAVGTDVSIGKRIHTGVALLGAHDVGALIDEDQLNVLVCDPCGAGGRTELRPIFGIDGGRADALAVSLGARVLLWGDSLLAFANLVVPLLDQGVVTEPVPLVGIEFGL